MTTPHYAAIYARVSTEDQGKGFSIPTQLEACQKLAQRDGYTVPEAYILTDEGISGITMDRPALRRLRELVAAKAIAAVVVIDPDRLSRHLGHQLPLAEEMERADVRLLIVSHPLEQGPEGWLSSRCGVLWPNMNVPRFWSVCGEAVLVASKPAIPMVGRFPTAIVGFQHRTLAIGKWSQRKRPWSNGSLRCVCRACPPTKLLVD